MRRCAVSSLRLTRQFYYIGGHAQHLWTRQCLSTASRQAKDHEATSPQSSQGSHGVKSTHLLARINARLPARYRQNAAAGVEDPESLANARALAALVRRGAFTNAHEHVDCLYDLAVRHGQWAAAVWVVKRLLETAPSDTIRKDNSPELIQTSTTSLHELTGSPINYKVSESAPTNIDSVVMSIRSTDEGRTSHATLGCVWRSLGRMILSSAGSVRPEVLEILALFHYHGLMPESVYKYAPSDQEDAIQQPATLYLLSSKIMVALSDAAWRARETAALESGQETDLEVRGSSVTANISALKPEVWLELVLWSCLHGGWLGSGADILVDACNKSWSAISWRQTLKNVFGIALTEQIDWDELSTALSIVQRSEYPALMHVERTLSSEVVAAYVDALADTTKFDGHGAFRVGRVLQYLITFHDFLKSSNLDLHRGSWDAIILRIIEHDGTIDKEVLKDFVHLSPHIGEELNEAQTKPAHVLDGNAALLGLLHRSLQHQISLGNVKAAMQVFDLIWECVDAARHRSLEDFFTSRLLESPDERFSFTGIEHPNFDPQIPPHTMAALLDLVTSSQATGLAKVLIYDSETESLATRTKEPHLISALMRLAAAIDNSQLLERLESVDHNALLCGHFLLKRWDSARSMLRSRQTTVDGRSLAIFGSSILSDDSKSAKHLIGSVKTRLRSDDKTRAVLSVLALVDGRFKARPGTQDLDTADFNIILGAVANHHGSNAAKELVDRIKSSVRRPVKHGKQSPFSSSINLRTIENEPPNSNLILHTNMTCFLIVLKQAILEAHDLDGKELILDWAVRGMLEVQRDKLKLSISDIKAEIMHVINLKRLTAVEIATLQKELDRVLSQAQG